MIHARQKTTWIGLVALFLATMAVACVHAAPASAEVIWHIKNNWADAHLPPGGKGKVYIQVRNMGDTPTTSNTTIKVDLPPGVNAYGLEGFEEKIAGNKDFQWQCTGSNEVTCTLEEPIGARYAEPYEFWYAVRLWFPVEIDAGATPGKYEFASEVTGSFAAAAKDVDPVTISLTPAPFGMMEDSFEGDTFAERAPFEGRERQAASHPYEMRVDFDMNLQTDIGVSVEGFPPQIIVTPTERLKTVETTLPRGLIGNPEALPKCSADQFTAGGFLPKCPPETQVGVIDVIISGGADGNGDWSIFAGGGAFNTVPVYNLEPPDGYAADLGFSLQGVRSHIFATLDASQGYSISALTPYIPAVFGYLDIRQVRFTAWGVPADPRHNRLRWPGRGGTDDLPGGSQPGGVPSTAAVRPFLTLSSACGEETRFQQRVQSYEHPDGWTARIPSSGPSLQPTGCDDPRLRFEPEVSLQPTSRSAGGPTGLAVNLEVPQRPDTVSNAADLYADNGEMEAIATPPIKKAVVTLPEGMTLSTSAAQGLGNCAPDQIRLGTNEPVTCPDSSKYGDLTIATPILPADEPMRGQIYVAKQNDNPFNNFLSLYLVIQDPKRGLLLKLPGKVDLDPVTGQVKTTFDDLPQFPVSNMQLAFKGGVRAALVNPTTCGTKTITAEFTPYSAPDSPVVVRDDYEIAQRGDGNPCVRGLGERPFRATLEAGTVSNSAGTYSPFAFRLQRTDDDQEFSQVNVTLPPGLLANISGLSKCSEAAIAQVGAPGRSGSAEANTPSCPAASRIGTTEVGSGVGQILTYIPGKVYLAGPYKGAPLSMVVVTPVLAGPYDLGVIAVRSAIDVNPASAQPTVRSDPFPQIFKGIPVRIRDIQVRVDRTKTIINPTSCKRMAVVARVTGTGGDVNNTGDDSAVELSNPFQASNCAALPFKPKLSFRLRGGTNRSNYPALTATLKAREGDANLARTKVTLPHSVFLAQEHIGTVCTRVQFAVDQCPAASVYGRAQAVSPLFDGALQGPVYLRSNGGERLLPDLVVALDGEIDVVLSGFIDSRNERIRNTFDVIPDAPVTKFTLSMFGGKKGLLVNSRNLCKGKARADVRMTGQNGKAWNTHPVMANSCKKKKKGSKRRAR
jgi:hypothetical protein